VYLHCKCTSPPPPFTWVTKYTKLSTSAPAARLIRKKIWCNKKHSVINFTKSLPTPPLANTLQHTATHCNTLQPHCNHTFTDWELLHIAWARAAYCNTLRHTATHCNALQRTATYYNTLQLSATQCNSLQHTATTLQRHCNNTKLRVVTCCKRASYTLQLTATHCNTLQHTATHSNTLQHIATYCNALQSRCNHTATTHSRIESRFLFQEGALHTATHCISLQHTATHCISMSHTSIQCNTLQHIATHCNYTTTIDLSGLCGGYN